MPTSQNGWLVLPADSPLLFTWTIPLKSGNLKIRMRNGSAGFVLALFIVWYDAHIESVYQKLLDDWGWAYRPIRGMSSGYSNHASGTAIDLNATKHPLGAVGTLIGLIRIKTILATKFKNVIRSGAFYIGRKDEMHYEIVKQVSDCEALAKAYMNRPSGKKILNANPSQRAVILS